MASLLAPQSTPSHGFCRDEPRRFGAIPGEVTATSCPSRTYLRASQTSSQTSPHEPRISAAVSRGVAQRVTHVHPRRHGCPRHRVITARAAAAAADGPSDTAGLKQERAIVPSGVSPERVWRKTPSWFKWPLLSFSLFYAWVVFTFGPPVARDLTPLWTIGPVGLAIVIWQIELAVRAAPAAISNSVTLARAGLTGGKDLIAYAGSGRLLSDASSAVKRLGERVNERQSAALEVVTGRKVDFSEYMGSGRWTGDLRVYLVNRAKDARHAAKDWAVQKVEDFTDWFFIARRRMAKFMSKLF